MFTNKQNRLALLLIVFGINLILFNLIVSVTSGLFFQEDAINSAQALRYRSTLTEIGVFGLTAWLFAGWVNDRKAASYLQLNKGIRLWQALLLILIFALSYPALSVIIEWNASIQFPEWLSSAENWLRTQENIAQETTTKLLAGEGSGLLLINILTVALVPAVCEELLFRGVVLGGLRRAIKNVHWAVFLSAVIFSAFHIQFFGFVPRLLLGLFLGYILVWSGSMWSSIIVHFVNNGMAVVLAYLFNNQIVEPDSIAGNHYGLTILSVLLTAVCMYIFYRKSNRDNKPEHWSETEKNT
jgi:membrane protease YdiL (CAAX protease family)